MDAGNSDYWILGNKFLASYVAWHDSETLQWGLTPGLDSTKIQPVYGTVNASSTDYSWIAIVTTSIGVVGILTVLIWSVIVRYSDTATVKNAEDEETLIILN